MLSQFAITAPGFVVVLQLAVLAALFASGALFLHWRGPRSRPAAVIKVVLLVLALLQVGICYGAHTAEVRLTNKHVAFKVPGFYGRAVPWSNVDFAGIKVCNLDDETDLQPLARTNGVGLFGYRLGWFKLNNGHMAWFAVTDPRRVVVIPQLHGPVDIVSVSEPDALAAQLKRIGERNSRARQNAVGEAPAEPLDAGSASPETR